MPQLLIELVGSQSGNVSLLPGDQRRTLKHMLTGTDDEAVARALVESTLPAFFDGQRFTNYTLEHRGCGIWEVETTYGTKRPPGTMTISFDTAGGQHAKQKMTQSLRPSRYYAPQGQQAVDYGGVLGIKDHNGIRKVEGIERPVEAFGFKITVTFGPEFPLTTEYVLLLRDLTKHINYDEVVVSISGLELTFEPGELFFVGATGHEKSGGVNIAEIEQNWEGELILEFEASSNIVDETIAGVPHVTKDGWDYVEAMYEDKDDGKVVIPKVKQVNVNPIFEADNLQQIIPTAPP